MRYLAILLMCASALAQQHKISVQKYEFPIYPVIAKQAHISADVKLQLEMLPSGEVQNVRVVTGHPMLTQAAIDTIKKWRFHCDDCAYGVPFDHQFTFSFRIQGETKSEAVFQLPVRLMVYAAPVVLDIVSSRTAD
jgi:TonB family protein